MQETLSPIQLFITIPSKPEEVWIKTDLFEVEKQKKLRLYRKYSDLRLIMFKTKSFFLKNITIEVFYYPDKEDGCLLKLEVRNSMSVQLIGDKMMQNHKYLMILYTFFKKHFPEVSDYWYC
jgi:hypothetical protein